MEFSHEHALALVQSNEQFPVDFDDAWQWIGYSTKQMARKKLVNNFEPGIDFLIKGLKSSTGGRSSEFVALTVDCLKSLGMMAGTKKGKEIRHYFLECERLSKKAAEVIPAQAQEIERLKLELELAHAQDSAARSQERLLQVSQAIVTLHGAGMLGLILNKPEAIIEQPPIVVEKNILVNQAGRPVKTYEGLSKTKLAKRYGMKNYTHKSRATYLDAAVPGAIALGWSPVRTTTMGRAIIAPVFNLLGHQSRKSRDA